MRMLGHLRMCMFLPCNSLQPAPFKSCGPQTSADTPFLDIVEQAGELEQVAVW